MKGACLLLAIVLAGGCGSTSSSVSPRERGNLRVLPKNDPAVLAAQRTAQRRWDEFARSFQFHHELDHEVKVAFPTRDRSREHLWIHVTAIRGRHVTGTIANDPVGDIGHVYGDRVTIARDRVEDWGIWRGRDLLDGGFSRAAVNRSRG